MFQVVQAWRYDRDGDTIYLIFLRFLFICANCSAIYQLFPNGFKNQGAFQILSSIAFETVKSQSEEKQKCNISFQFYGPKNCFSRNNNII